MILVKSQSKSFESTLGKKLFSLAICLLSLLPLKAQQLNFYAVDQVDGKPVPNVTIWTFNIGKKAIAAKYALDNGTFDESKADITAKGVTGNDGFVGLKCSPTGYIMVEVISGQYDYAQTFQVSRLLKGTDVKIKIPRATGDGIDGAKVLNEVEVVDVRPIPKSGDGIAERFGKLKTISKELEIDPQYARSDARYVMAAHVELPQQGDSVALNISPAVVDGKAYRETMYRHSYYVKDNDYGFKSQQDGGFNMEDHQGERFTYTRYLYPVQRGVKYVVKGKEWYEDYKNVYYTDDVLISDGNDREPMRFLNWDDAKRAIPINREQYKREGKSEMQEYPMSFKMEFEVGENELNLGDSTTVRERDRLMNWIAQYYNDENSQINHITIRGYASPEGGYDRNVTLSHGRANVIAQMIKNRFPSSLRLQNVKTQFDKYNNIVPWSVVADTMDVMQDSLAHYYAERIRSIVAERSSLDAQQAEIRKDAAMWDYLKTKVLPTVRRVEITANVTTMRVLSREEIIAKYESDNGDFHAGKSEMDYQYYELMCYLADKEDWEALYTMSKAAYESPVMSQVATKLIEIPASQWTEKEREAIEKKAAEEGKPVPTSTLRRQEINRPDPLAGYYYASSLLRRGIVNTNVLKPFLDDGDVNRIRRVGSSSVVECNDLSIISMQILMYCQDDDFQAANNMIQKYDLTRFPELKTLIMFVRCLNGEYRTDPEVRDFVAQTSPMNHAVIAAATEDYTTALNLLDNEVSQDDARVHYLKAICLFNRLPQTQRDSRVDHYNSVNIYSGDAADEDEASLAWAAPMLQAFKLESTNADYIKSDGYFNDAYRQLTLYFWQRLQQGATMDTIAKEYDQLVEELEERKKQQ